MQTSQFEQISDLDVRQVIYKMFAENSRAPTIAMVADHFKISIAAFENTYKNLAKAHYIALATGSLSI